MRAVVVFVVAVVTMAHGLVTGFRVEPVKAAWSGKADPEDGVAQVLTVNFDELNSASGAYCELFAGTMGGGGAYHVSVRTYPGGTEIATGDTTGNLDHKWVRFKLGLSYPESIVKGNKLKFQFTRSGQDSIQYYYDEACGYDYGQMIAPYPPSITPSYGLAMRVYGRMKPVDSTYWGMVPELPWNPDWLKRAWRDSMRTAGVGLARLEIDWNQVQPNGPTGYSFGRTDDQLEWIQDSAKCEVFAVLTRCPKWTSSRREWKQLEGSPDSWYWDTVPYCAPRNLWPRPESTNYWAQWLDTLVEHVGDKIQVWEIWNEPNDTCTDPSADNTGWWRRPNMDSAYPGLGGQERGLCSLYVRFCEVADSVIKLKTGHENDRVLIGSVYSVNKEYNGLVAGTTWVRTCYDVAGTVFWDGVAAHPYQDEPDKMYDFRKFEADADTLRALMKHYEHNGELWGTEFGVYTSGDSPADAARAMAQVFIAAKASETNPGRGWDRLCWWLFRKASQACGHYPLVNSLLDTCYASFHAFKQMTNQLTGKRFNGRAMTGDTATDTLVRMYEFEDTTTLKKTWVCWSDEATAPPTTFVKLPARSDTTSATDLDYGDDPPPSDKQTAATGWLPCTLVTRPVFIAERGGISRPDLVVDSTRYFQPPDSIAVRAWVTNRGNRATPRQTPGNQPYPTWAVLYANGDSIAEMEYTDSIPAESSAVFEFARGDMQTPLTALLEVRVNPGQSYVELGTDENSGYRLKTQQ